MWFLLGRTRPCTTVVAFLRRWRVIRLPREACRASCSRQRWGGKDGVLSPAACPQHAAAVGMAAGKERRRSSGVLPAGSEHRAGRPRGAKERRGLGNRLRSSAAICRAAERSEIPGAPERRMCLKKNEGGNWCIVNTSLLQTSSFPALQRRFLFRTRCLQISAGWGSGGRGQTLSSGAQ